MGLLLKCIGYLILGIVGILVISLVVSVALVGLAFLDTPKPSCADGSIAVSPAAAASFDAKWRVFDSALQAGQAASVTLTEEELTSRGAGYLVDLKIPARNLQVHLCPGQGSGQAAMTLQTPVKDVDVVASGHFDVGARQRIVVDSVQFGRVPGQIGGFAFEQLLEQLERAANVTPSSGIREVSTTNTTITLKGQK